MATYFKAYRVSDLNFAGWQANPELEPQTIVYLRQDLKVVQTCMADSPILFESDSEAWKEYCTRQLGFILPNWDEEDRQAKESQTQADTK